jgi:acyl carrier protein
MDPLRQCIVSFIVDNFYVPDASTLGDDVSLLDRGIVDSTGVLELTAFLEREFAIAIADDEIVAENLDTIGAITRFVARKRALAA